MDASQHAIRQAQGASSRHCGGFTLTELVVVITIIGIMAAMIILCAKSLTMISSSSYASCVDTPQDIWRVC